MDTLPSVKDLPRLYKGEHWERALREMNPLVREVFKVTYTEQFLKPFLAELKQAGYKKVWIGTDNPHWSRDMQTDMIVAEPSVRAKGGVGTELMLWKVYKNIAGDLMFMVGNGLGRDADQLQGAGWLCLFQGEYSLE